jgi:methionyl-tRNA synthetase
MTAAQSVNAYLNATEPWKMLKVDRERGLTQLYVALSAINGVRVAMSPFIPFSARQLDAILGEPSGWARVELVPGTPIDKPSPLFAKVDLADEPADDGAA